MQRGKQPLWRRKIVFVVVFLMVNLISVSYTHLSQERTDRPGKAFL